MPDYLYFPVHDDHEKGDQFVTHLKNVFTPNLKAKGFTAVEPLCFDIRVIDKAITELKSKKTLGIDKISNKMLMELPRIAIKILLMLSIRIEGFIDYNDT